VDPTLFTIYGQEKVKHSLEMELIYTMPKIAIWIMDHDPEDCGMSKSDFEMYSTDNFYMHADNFSCNYWKPSSNSWVKNRHYSKRN
jgi:hypothetical protein